jgi:hypothetical protein
VLPQGNNPGDSEAADINASYPRSISNNCPLGIVGGREVMHPKVALISMTLVSVGRQLVRRRERYLRTNASGSSAFDIAPFNTAETSQTKENWLDTHRRRRLRRPVGWVVGGIAYAAWDHVTLKLEYLHYGERQWRDQHLAWSRPAECAAGSMHLQHGCSTAHFRGVFSLSNQCENRDTFGTALSPSRLSN